MDANDPGSSGGPSTRRTFVENTGNETHANFSCDAAASVAGDGICQGNATMLASLPLQLRRRGECLNPGYCQLEFDFLDIDANGLQDILLFEVLGNYLQGVPTLFKSKDKMVHPGILPEYPDEGVVISLGASAMGFHVPAAADLDGDGDIDIVFAGQYSTDKLYVLENTGSPTHPAFTRREYKSWLGLRVMPDIVGLGNNAINTYDVLGVQPFLSDVDGDGMIDFCMTQHGGRVSDGNRDHFLFACHKRTRATGAERFTRRLTKASGWHFADKYFGHTTIPVGADLNGDGRSDLIVSSQFDPQRPNGETFESFKYGLQFYENLGPAPAGGEQGGIVRFADTGVELVLKEKDGTLIDTRRCTHFAFFDYAYPFQDGDLDLVVVISGDNYFKLDVFENVGNAAHWNFVRADNLLTGLEFEHIWRERDPFWMAPGHLGGGGNSQQLAPDISVGHFNYEVCANANDRQDICGAKQCGKCADLSILIASEAYEVTPSLDYSPFYLDSDIFDDTDEPWHSHFYISGVAFGDIDGDGDDDAIVGYRSGRMRYFERVVSDGTTSAAQKRAWRLVRDFSVPNFDSSVFAEGAGGKDSQGSGVWPRPTLLDYDGDGDLDLVVGVSSGFVYLYEQNVCSGDCSSSGSCDVQPQYDATCTCLGTGDDGNGACSACSAGAFFSEDDTITHAGTCAGCGSGKHGRLDHTRANETATCRDCPSGYMQSKLVAGSCDACPAGQYQSAEGAVSCLPCTPGRWQNRSGQTSCEACGNHTASNRAGRKVPCGACMLGFSAPEPGSSKCTRCEAGKAGATCVECDKGKYRTGDDTDPKACDDCPKGYYQDVQGQASCLPCLPGEFGNETGMQACHKCDVGTVSATSKSWNCSDCDAGSSSNLAGGAKCTPCGAGKYSNTTGQKCTGCDKGRYRASGDTDPKACDDCPKGYYQDVQGQASCLPCLPGEFGNETGMQACHKCDVGTVSATSKSWNCSDCDAGSSSNLAGGAKCTPCGAGKYSNTTGQKCTGCDKGRYPRQRRH